jgi:hypothetical protein
LARAMETEDINGSSGFIHTLGPCTGVPLILALPTYRSPALRVVRRKLSCMCMEVMLIVSGTAYVEGVRSVLDPNPMPPGLYQYSVIVSTPQREMKFTAPTKERHDIWFNVCISLSFSRDTVNYSSVSFRL